MNHSMAISAAELTPTYEERVLRAFLSVLFLLPLAILQYVVILVLNWLLHRLLYSIIRHYSILKLTSEDQEAIKTVSSNLAKLSQPLNDFYDLLCQMKKHKVLFVSKRVKRVAEMIDNYNDLVLAYNIFAEPVRRDYYVTEEFNNLRRGRKIINSLRERDDNSIRQKDDFLGQIVFPTQH